MVDVLDILAHSCCYIKQNTAFFCSNTLAMLLEWSSKVARYDLAFSRVGGVSILSLYLGVKKQPKKTPEMALARVIYRGPAGPQTPSLPQSAGIRLAGVAMYGLRPCLTLPRQPGAGLLRLRGFWKKKGAGA